MRQDPLWRAPALGWDGSHSRRPYKENRTPRVTAMPAARHRDRQAGAPPASLAATTVAAVRLDELPCDRQPESTATGVGGAESGRRGARIAGDARPGVDDREPTSPAQRGDEDGHRPAGRRVADGVGQQVGEDLREPHRIGVELGVSTVHRQRHLAARGAGVERRAPRRRRSAGPTPTRGGASGDRRQRGRGCASPRPAGRACAV